MITNTPVAAMSDKAEIIRGLRLILEPGQVTELRILDATTAADRRPHVESGYFDDVEKLAEAAASITSAKGFYFVLNPTNPALLARAQNRIRNVTAGKKPTTSDVDITARRWLPLDIDPGNPADVSATDAEHDSAIELAYEIRAALASEGWPEPIVADSGNGAHLLYRIDQPADDEGLIERVLQGLAQRWPKIDVKVGNAARIWKLYGTVACKGDNTQDRPHRMARILEAPAAMSVVRTETLEAIAAEVNQPKQATRDHSRGLQPFDVAGFVQRYGLDIDGPNDWTGRQGTGKRWTFRTSPMCDHHDGAAFILQHASGAVSATCQHNSCSWKWADLRTRFEQPEARRVQRPRRDYADPDEVNRALAGSDEEQPAFTHNGHAAPATNPDADDCPPDETAKSPIRPIPAEQLIAQYPRLREPVIAGLLRRGESGNIIAPSKVGKSWLVDGLALAVVTGGRWLGFQCHRGRVLLIDNELHSEDIAHRLAVVAAEMGLTVQDYAGRLEVIRLRGRLTDLHGVGAILADFQPGSFDLLILDAWYRALPIGVSENDNGAVAGLYNAIDVMADRLQCAWLNVHHSSKGSQAEKSVADVGAGAGSQSRAVDMHAVLRPHDDEGVFVLEAVVRSFAPVEPIALRWQFPLWHVDGDADPAMLRGRLSKGEERQLDKDTESKNKILAALLKGPQNIRHLRGAIGAGSERLNRLLDALEVADAVEWEPVPAKGGTQRIYRLKESGP